MVNTHGIHGELRVEPWCDSPEFLQQFKTLYRGEDALAVERSRPHKHFLLVKLAGIDTVEAAQRLKGTVLHIDRAEAVLPEGRFFVQDLIGLRVADEQGNPVGELTDVISLPAHDVYVVQGADGEHMIPVRPEFVLSVDAEAGCVTVRLIEGM